MTKNKNENIEKEDIQLEDNIIHKIYAIQSEVKEIVKNEKNPKLHYDFFGELPIFRMLKPLFKKHRLAVMLSDDPTGEFECRQVGTNQYLVRYLKRLEITNVKSGDDVTTKDIVNKVDSEGGLTYRLADETKTFSFWAIGLNTDPAKAKGAAETYAAKYIFSKLFIIPIIGEKDDPDYHDNSESNKSNDNNKAKTVIALNEKSQKLYDLFVEVRGSDKSKQKELLFELDKIVVGVDKYKLDTNTGAHNFRERLNLLDEADYKKYWDALESKKTK